MEFDNKVVIVTGSTSGLGEEIALTFAKNGAKVVINGRNETRLAAVVDKCLEASPTKQKPLAVLADVCDDKQLENLVNKTIETFGKIDVLVNNAGFVAVNSVEDPKLIENFDKVINCILRSTVVLSTLAIPHLIASKGCIINITSIGSVKPVPYLLPNCAANAAKDMVTRSLALELGPKGVRVNSIRVGYVKTPIFDAHGLKFEEMEDVRKIPLQKHGEPQDVANAVLFLASSKSDYMTGTNLLLDGGFTNL